jgi:putative ABC transport system permease protein
MTLWRLALRNLRRNQARSALTVSAVVAGVGLLVLGESLVAGTKENIIVAAEDAAVGHLTARPKGYPAEGLQQPVDRLLELSPQMRDFLDRNTVAWTERTLFTPLASIGRDAIRVGAIGYDPERDERVFPRRLWKVDGALPAPGRDEIAVSRGVARLLSLKPGDRLVLQVRTHPGAINALEVRVAGVLTTNNPSLDSMSILVPAPLAAQLIAAGQPTHVSMRLGDRREAESFKPRLLAALGEQAEAVSWDDESRDLVRLQEIRRRGLELVVVVLLALAAFGMANTILIAAHERVREVGTLRAMGMTEGGVVRLFLIEGGLLGLVGSLVGLAWGGGLSAYWMRHPIDFSKLVEQTSGSLSFSTLVYTRLEPRIVLWAAVFGVVTAVAASVYPARVASRMAPADAVRAD